MTREYMYPSAIRRRSRWCSYTKQAYRDTLGIRLAVMRAYEIVALDTKLWKGVRVYRVTCQADFGKGPHVQWIPAATLWSLIDIGKWQCAWHRP